jgi:hypothetical protein
MIKYILGAYEIALRLCVHQRRTTAMRASGWSYLVQGGTIRLDRDAPPGLGWVKRANSRQLPANMPQVSLAEYGWRTMAQDAEPHPYTP